MSADRGARPARRPVPAADRTRSYGPDRQATLRARGGLVLRPARRRASAQRCGTASVFAGGFDLRGAVRGHRDEPTTSRCCGCSTRWSASPSSSPTTSSARTRYSLYETIRAFADEPAAAGPVSASVLRDRHAAYFAERGRRERWERWNGPGWRDPGRLGAGRAGQPAVGVPLERRDAVRSTTGHRRRRPRGPDGVLGRAVRDRRMGRGRCSRPGDRGRRHDGCPRLYAAAGYACFVGRAADGDRARPPATELETEPGYESCEPGYATFIEALGAGLLRRPRLGTSS